MATILIAEQSCILAHELQSLVRGLGHAAPALVASGDDVVTEALDLRPELLFIDVNLDGAMRGLRAAAAVRQRLDVPVVYLTSPTDAPALEHVLATGPFGSIVTPLDPHAVRAAIDVALFKHRVEAQQRERERWYAAVLRETREAVITSDADGRITFINPAAEALVGRSRRTAFGRMIDDVVALYAPDARTPLPSPCAGARSDGARVELAAGALVRRDDGSATAVAGHAAPIPSGAVLVLRAANDAPER